MSIEIVFVLDRSGSMAGNESDVIGGVNTLLDKQRESGVHATVSMFKFDTEYNEISRHIPLADAKLLAEEYVPRGGTALMDAVGKTINAMGEDYKKSETPPQGVMFVIFTDGMENASREFTRDKVKTLISRQENEWNWEFVYMGAHADAFKESDSIGLRRTDTRGFAKSRGFAKTQAAFTQNYADLSAQTVAYAHANDSTDDSSAGDGVSGD